jgi:hypothetical protein
MTEDDAVLLAAINRIEIGDDELLKLAGASETYHRDHPGAGSSEVGFALIAAHVDGDEPRKAFALWSRMNALAKLLRDGGDGAPGWTLAAKGPDGAVFAQEAVFRAAAVHPLIQQGNEWVFDRASFLDRVLRVAKSEGSA